MSSQETPNRRVGTVSVCFVITRYIVAEAVNGVEKYRSTLVKQGREERRATRDRKEKIRLAKRPPDEEVEEMVT